MSFRGWSKHLLVAGIVSLSFAPAAFACQGEIWFRVWQPGVEEAWYDYGETIELGQFEDAAIFVHVQAGDDTYSTQATIGYPREFGLQGDPFEVEKRVKMQAQNNDDRSQGRIRFKTDQRGVVQLGYRITGVSGQGGMSNVSRGCASGPIPISVSN